ALLYLGKKLYIRNDISTWDYLQKDIKLEIADYCNIENESFEEFIKLDRNNNNKEKIELISSDAYIKKIWEKVF
ncbi:hypothetical protein V7147_24750, partial [Bacillus sp. JJ1521]|uniref:hypothetical protein n=1 Tax=Bacillus sp. JJ1521 TaxID=3122957 RepID=UPI002FFE2476